MSVFIAIIIKRLNDQKKPPLNGQYIIRRVLGAGGSEGELFVDGDGPEGEAIVGEGGAAAKAPFAGDNHLRNRFPSDGLCAC